MKGTESNVLEIASQRTPKPRNDKRAPMRRMSQGGNLLQARPGRMPTFSPISLATPSRVIWLWLKPKTDFKE